MSDWDAARYDRVSDPQVGWGRRVMLRLAPRAGERILDLGCGTGRLTTEMSALVPGGLVVGLDRSQAMLNVARSAAPSMTAAMETGSLYWVRADGLSIPFVSAFDAVFSTATLHWISDHPAAFQSVLSVLRPAGRLVAQCGGGRNLERLYSRAAILMRTRHYADFFDGWRDPWLFASADSTREALEHAGFTAVDTWLEEAPTFFHDASAYSEFVRCVCLRHHLERLPPDQHAAFVAELARAAASDDPPFTLDYWRLNIDARRPPA
jgi:trans-aconitate 2-methyltransferase